jgi:3'(2'), 5'-bisphosphate nucleotidase
MDSTTHFQIDIADVISIAREAGKKILDIYTANNYHDSIIKKDDKSPLTMADKASHEYIFQALQQKYPYPIISEEGEEIPYSERRKWRKFWLVDPLDGTKEFIKRNGNFTVNIAFIVDEYPVLGVIYVPVTDVMYYADQNGAYKQQGNEEPIRLIVPELPDYYNLRGVSSESYSSEEDKKAMEILNITKSIAIGSSLKFCLLAENKADLYIRNNPLMEWDAAAGQAIIEISGGRVFNIDDERLAYNQPNLLISKVFGIGYRQNDGMGWKKLNT